MKTRLPLCVFLWLLASKVLAEVTDVDPQQLTRLIAEGVPVVDVRTPAEWRRTGVIKGSHLLMFFDEQRRADPEEWLKQLRQVVDTNSEIVLICASGNRSRLAAELLSDNGLYQKIYNANGGMRGWLQQGGPVMSQ